MTPSDSQTGPELEFLTFTTIPARDRRGADDEENRRIVRSHAIRDANRRKKLASGNNLNNVPIRPPSKPKPQSTFTARFRLDSHSKKSNSCSRDHDVERNIKELSKQIQIVPQHSARVHIGPSGSKFDPFDTLPVALGPRARAVVEFHKLSTKKAVFHFYSRDRLFNAAAGDPAWFNATLALISLNYDLKVGGAVSPECLLYRGEALRLVNERLNTTPAIVDDYTVAAIASLANFDTTNGSRINAKMHVEGLLEIMALRGDLERGLFALEGNHVLQKIVAWCDLSYATLYDVSPNFAILQVDGCTASLTTFIEIFSPGITSRTDFSSPHDLFGEMSDIFQVLRLLSICMTKDSITASDQYLFARGIYITEYKLLTVLDQIDPYEDDIMISRNSHIYGSCRLAAYLYIYFILRELPPSAEINRTLARRLKFLLGTNHANLLDIWKDDLYLLLWIVSMGAIATLLSAEASYFAGILGKLIAHIGLETPEQYRDALQEIVWIDDTCRQRAISALWSKISPINMP